MSTLGKSLVVLHGGLSLFLLAWSFGIFTNKIQWATTGGSGSPRIEGEVSKKQEEFNNVMRQAVVPANQRYLTQRGTVGQQERLIAGDRQYYAKELQHLRTEAAPTAPARQVLRDPQGHVALDPNAENRPRMQALNDSTGTPLLSLQAYRDLYNQELKKYLGVADRLDKAAKADKEATDKLRGPKGLHARIQAELKKQDKVKQEQKDVRPHYINSAVELELLKNLEERLSERVKELQEAIGTRTP